MRKNYPPPATARLLWLALCLVALLRPGLTLAQFNHPQDTLFGCGTQRDTAQQRSIVLPNSSCTDWYGYSPEFYAKQGLPEIPIKKVRIMFHVYQKDDGTGNWQSPAQDGGLDEPILTGLLNGLTNFPTPGSPHFRGLNELYGQLDNVLLASGGGNQTVTPATGSDADTRIRFQLEGIRYYRSTELYDMSTGSPQGCIGSTGSQGQYCGRYYYKTVVTNTTDNQFGNGQLALTHDQQYNVLHIFWAEHPGVASTKVDAFGNLTSRYQSGGVAGNGWSIPAPYFTLRGQYWLVKHYQWGSIQGSLPG
ncbi:hypothetical protein Q5H93_13645 [Hymenobacter sp. ASUV-10]|uniref:Uncharacterized protein n=1 Tax=Hymenobacter aranciens TaxID=3063996 RepID=A0ABT9BBZ3_9BACT|nr:hypothetical protein [Hymenobacter sp. ASUV-10]MDO7875782.1 hypothetical protein [Hymenobacter sp. ASUV-10]